MLVKSSDDAWNKYSLSIYRIALALALKQYIDRSIVISHHQSNEPPPDKPNAMTTPSEDSDQPGNPPSLIRVFTVRSMGR